MSHSLRMSSIAVNAKFRSLNPRLQTATIPRASPALPPAPPPKTKTIVRLAPPEPEPEPEMLDSQLEIRRRQLYVLEFGHLNKPPKKAPEPAPEPAPKAPPAPKTPPAPTAPVVKLPPQRKFTPKELADFNEIEYNKPFTNIRTGDPYRENTFGINPRGDIVDADFNYLGSWDEKTQTIIPAKISKERGDGNERLPILPDDWLAIRKASME
jgi:hypothetical protein